MGPPEEPPANQYATITKQVSPNKNQQAGGNSALSNQRRQQEVEEPYDDETAVSDQYSDQGFVNFDFLVESLLLIWLRRIL